MTDPMDDQDRGSAKKTIVILLIALLIALLVIAGCTRIISTYSIFSQTWDEPAHIAAGMQWLQQGKYTFEPMHPPLARVMSALGLYWSGLRIREDAVSYDQMWKEGNAILLSGGQYQRNLTLARLGILPFFILASIIVALWAKDLGGLGASLAATFLFTTLPPVLAHAGLATTDMAAAALIAAAAYSFSRWRNQPSHLNNFIFGLSLGLATLAKFTALYFLVFAFGLIVLLNIRVAVRRPAREGAGIPHDTRWVRPLAAVLLVSFLVIWAGYRFSLHSLLNPANEPFDRVDGVVGKQGLLHEISYFALGHIPVPATEAIFGIYDTFTKNQIGRTTFLMGEVSSQSRWYFYPVVFIFKTPLPFLLLALFGLILIIRQLIHKSSLPISLFIPLSVFFSVFLISMMSNMNLGLRQVISVYPLLAIVAGYGTVRLPEALNNKRLFGVVLLAILFAWQVVSSSAAHPDYLAYFNELAGSHPEQIAIDSDLDWGQDLRRLSETLQDLGVKKVFIRYYGSEEINLDEFGLPSWQPLQPYRKELGWVAISISAFKFGTNPEPLDQYAWLEEYQPVRKVGKSILLYYIPMSESDAAAIGK